MDRLTPAFTTSFISFLTLQTKARCITQPFTANLNTERNEPLVANCPGSTPRMSHAASSQRGGSIVSEQCAAISRRSFLETAGAVTVLSLLLADRSIAEEGAGDTQLSTYKGPVSLGYSFSYPTSWSVKKKPIKTHLSEIIVTDTAESSTSAGLVVDAVKIDSIDKFGTPDSVGQKVVAVETKKESVKEAYVTAATSQMKGGLMYYVIDYTVDSTRGVKRYKAKATVSSNQLYVFTTQAKVDNYKDIENTLSQMLDSFNVVKQYL